MKTMYISIILFLAFCLQTMAQEKSSHEIKGDTYAFNYSYNKAITSYTKANPLTIAGQRKLAESYHNLEDNIMAEEVYSKIVQSKNNYTPEDLYNYATILKINRKYDLYTIWMTKFVELSPYDLRAIDFNNNKNKFNSLSRDKSAFKITHLNINTSGEDFGTCFYKDKIIFSSSRGGSYISGKKDNWTGVPYSDLYISNIENGQLTKPELFENKFNSTLHDGPASFSNNGTFMAFTKNNSKDKTSDKVVELQIYTSNYVNNTWTKPESFFLNNTTYSVGQPCLTENGKTMYFTSDMPGGYGGADLYRVSRADNGNWGLPQNLGSTINTEGDEMFPFIEEKNDVLYFSSNGRFGLGGLDIFSGKVKQLVFDSVTNLGFPLNTRFDDFALIVNDSTKTGYFTSNRAGGAGNDDMYAVSFLKPTEDYKITGYAINENGNVIPNVFIKLLNIDGAVEDSITTIDNDAYSFSIDPNSTYVIVGKKQSYIDGNTTFNTFDIEQNINADVTLINQTPKNIVSELKQTSKKNVSEKIKVGIDLAEILDFNPSNIYFDFSKSNIRADAIFDLDKIVDVMNEYPSMIIKLSAYADCRSTESYNQKLSERRAKSTVDYIKKRITTPSRISGEGFGETNPIIKCISDDINKTSNCTEEEHQQNRRTEFLIIKT